ncbi:MAG: hypothetical protein U0414_27405 [Polyangiaceae bacterium]
MLDRPQILAELARTRTQPVDVEELRSLGFPPHYLALVAEVGVQEIAPDFLMPTSMHVAVENLRNAKRLGSYLVFGVSASGDMWLLDKDPSRDRVAFLPQEEESGPRVELGIGLDQWFELALFMRTHEAAKARAKSESEKRALKARAKKFIETMSRTLAEAYPYLL